LPTGKEFKPGLLNQNTIEKIVIKKRLAWAAFQ
jgi:hypothetical protein